MTITANCHRDFTSLMNGMVSFQLLIKIIILYNSQVHTQSSAKLKLLKVKAHLQLFYQMYESIKKTMYEKCLE